MTNVLERREPLGQRIQEILKTRINEGTYPPNARFPSQNELAEEFGVSRATVRSAVDMLSAEGYLEKRQGLGTWVSESALLSRQATKFRDLPMMVAERGLKPGYFGYQAEEQQPSSRVAESLRLSAEDTVIRVEAVFSANDVPVLYGTVFYPTRILGQSLKEAVLANPEIAGPSILDFIEKRCNQDIKHFESNIRSDFLINCPMDIPPEEENAIAVVFDEVCINTQDQPIAHIINYFPSNRIVYSLRRYPARGDQDANILSNWMINP